MRPLSWLFFIRLGQNETPSWLFFIRLGQNETPRTEFGSFICIRDNHRVHEYKLGHDSSRFSFVMGDL